MKTKTKGIPRYRRFDGPIIFGEGFRPFFLGAGVWSFFALALWIGMLGAGLDVPTAFGPAAWHAHEMIFGFAVAAMSGFLLTAIPNWTGRMPLQGPALMVLFATWLVGRAAVATSALTGPGPAAVADLSFLVLLCGVVVREIVSGRNWRNLPMPAALGLLILANGLTHIGLLRGGPAGPLGERLGIATIILLISLVGGRIIPSFTRNWLVKRGESDLPAGIGGWFDRACLALTVVALGAWVAEGAGPIMGALLVATGLANLLRLARWRGYRTLSEPLVWSLHLGFSWVPVGLCLIGLGMAAPERVPLSAGLHAFTAGAIGAMTLAVMTRATLGHTGRALAADRWTAAIYVLVFAAAVLRVCAAVGLEPQGLLLWVSGFSWCAAFGLFAVRYGAMLLSRRAEA